jgi:hypothetical protein
MSKSYRSLADVYTGNAFKPVSKLPRQVVNEKVKVFFKSDNDTGPVAIGTIEDDEAARLKRKIFNSEKGVIKGVNDLLKECDWTKKGKVPKLFLASVLERIENNTDVNPEGLQDVIDNKNSINGLENRIENDTGGFNLLEVLKPVASKMFVDNIDETVIDLINFDFKQGVSVGKGELAITMFSNSKKGKKGDLLFPSAGEVELKGTDGRPGKKGDAVAGVLEFIPSLYKRYGVSDKRHDIALKNILSIYRTSRDKLLGLTDALIENKTINPYPTKQQLSEFRKDIEQIDSNISNDIVNGKDKNQLIQTVSQILQRDYPKFLNQKSITLSGKKFKNYITLIEEFFNAFTSYRTLLNQKEKSKLMDRPFSSEIILDFFNDDQLGISLDDKVRGFLSLRSEKLRNDKPYSSALYDILEKNNDILVSKDIDENGNASIRPEAENLIGNIIASMQVAMYAQAEEFSYIMFFNNNTLDCISFQMLDDPKANFMSLFEKFSELRNSGRLNYKLDLDPHYGKSGIKIAYEG